MKRIIIICEGQTEQQFCNDILQPHFNQQTIYLDIPVIKKTKGGIPNWNALRYQIETHLKEDTVAFVTTLIDFYGIHEHHEYPGWQSAKTQQDKNAGMDIMEKGMSEDIKPELRNRFIPYVQLHEFEALLFSDIEVYDNSFDADEFLDYTYLVRTITDHPNPEMINDGKETAPSKRVLKIIKGYNKVVHGSLLARDIGLVKIREKCPRFNSWLHKIETV